jgi:antitoxin component YwqK of YwqJK toxin-antitoxin module
VSLKVNQKYFIVCAALKSEPIEINLSSNSVSVDTFFIPKLKIKYPDQCFNWNPDYYSCNLLINGNYVEYFKNGNLRYIGCFHNGKVKDTLKSYFRTGELKSINIVSGKQTIFIDYFKNGQIRVDVNTNKKYRYYYYKSGALKCKIHNKKGSQINYFKNGTLQANVQFKDEKIYYSNGSIKKELKKTKYKFIDHLRLKKDKIEFLYVWTDFDTLGNKTREIVFTSSEFHSLFNGSIYKFPKENYLWVEYYANNIREVLINVGTKLDKYGYLIDIYYLNQTYGNEILPEEIILLKDYSSILEKFDLKYNTTGNKLYKT